jgi:hypothetical protein
MTQPNPNPPSTATIDTLYQDIRQLIEAAKTHVATRVNQALVLTYWQIGKSANPLKPNCCKMHDPSMG